MNLTTPKQDGFRMPGEFEPHAGCWMAWPHRPDNWRMNAAPAQRAFAEVASAISQFEPVTMCANAKDWEMARRMLPAHIRVIELSSNDAWLRDQGPSFVVNDAANGRGELRGVDWQFNAWGGMYADCANDQLIAQKILEIEHLSRYAADLVMEGGAFHVDGEFTCITTEECLLNPNRNPHLTQAQIEAKLCAYLNVDNVIWLKHGVYRDDDTSGHVDNLCCFVRPGVVALGWTDDRNDPQYARSLDAYERLMDARDAKGRRLSVVKVPMPEPLHMTQAEFDGLQRAEDFEGDEIRSAGKRLAGSYINFYIASGGPASGGPASGGPASGGIVMPGFGVPQDEAARAVIQSLFPERKVVQIYSREILLGGGNIHCITQQQPAVKSGMSSRKSEVERLRG
jgi:agmatine deiminase